MCKVWFNVFFFCLFLWLTIAAFLKQSFTNGTLYSIIALCFFCALVFVTSPEELGQGRVPKKPEKLAKRLKTGVVYHTVAAQRYGDEQILLLQESGTPKYLAIRVDEINMYPEYFTLIDGSSVAIKK